MACCVIRVRTVVCMFMSCTYVVLECIMQAKIEDETDVDDTHQQKGRFNLVTRNARRKLPSSLAPQELSAVFFHLTGVVDVFKTVTSRVLVRDVSRVTCVSCIIGHAISCSV